MTTQYKFRNHEVVQRSPDDYIQYHCNPMTILQAWQLSTFAHELLDSKGQLKDESHMHPDTLEKFLMARDTFKHGESLAIPIIGIGIMDNIEIGIGREIIAAACALNIPEIPIHIRAKQAKEIAKMIGIKGQ